MARKDAILYIQNTRKAGFSDVEIRRELERQGWPETEIDGAFDDLSSMVPKPKLEAPVITPKPKSSPTQTPSVENPFKKEEPHKSVPSLPNNESKSVVPKVEDGPKLEKAPKQITRMPEFKKPQVMSDIGKPPVKKEEAHKSMEVPNIGGIPLDHELTAGVKPKKLPVTRPPKQSLPPETKPKTPPPGAPSLQANAPQENILESVIKEESAPAKKQPKEKNSPKTEEEKPNIIARTLGLGSMLVATATILGAGAWIYIHKVEPGLAVKEALQNFQETNSFSYEADVQITLSDDPTRVSEKIEPFVPQLASLFLRTLPLIDAEPAKNVRMRIDGAVDYSRRNDPLYEMSMFFGTEDFFNSDVSFEAKYKNGTNYFRLTNIPYFGASFGPFGNTAFEESWIIFRDETVAKDIDTYVDRLSHLDTSFSVYRIGGRPLAQVLPLEDVQNSVNASFIDWGEDIKREYMDGLLRYHITGVLNEEALLAFGFDEEFEEDVMVDAWIGADSRSIDHVSVSYQEDETTFLLTVSLGDLNKPLDVESPQRTRELEDALDEVYDFIVEDLLSSNPRARDIQRVQDLSAIQAGLGLYYDRLEEYPNTLPELVPEYMVVLPLDPESGKRYPYKKKGDGYILSAKFENRQSELLKDDADPGDFYYDVKPAQ